VSGELTGVRYDLDDGERPDGGPGSDAGADANVGDAGSSEDAP